MNEHDEPREAEIQRWMARTEWQGLEQAALLPDMLGYQYAGKPRTTFGITLSAGEMPVWIRDVLGRKLFCRWVNRLNGHQVAGYAALMQIEADANRLTWKLYAIADTADLVFATS